MTLRPRPIDASSKICTITEQQHLRMLEEAFGCGLHHALLNHVLCAENSCKLLPCREKVGSYH